MIVQSVTCALLYLHGWHEDGSCACHALKHKVLVFSRTQCCYACAKWGAWHVRCLILAQHTTGIDLFAFSTVKVSRSL